MLKKIYIMIVLFWIFFLTSCGNKEVVNTQTDMAPMVENNVTDVEEKEETPITAPKETCTPKKFAKNYKYFYATKEECTKESQSTAFFDIVDNIDSRVFTVNCDEIVDDCGTTWYGVSYNIYDPDNSTREDGVVVVYY